MSYLRTVVIAAMLLFVHTAMAERTVYETGTIKSVDLENNTFTVELGNSGATKTYSFPEMIMFIDNGTDLVDKSAFKPGQSVNLKFEAEKPRFANPGIKANNEYSLKGMTVN
jgi:Cu/Ag efflux protein CusF